MTNFYSLLAQRAAHGGDFLRIPDRAEPFTYQEFNTRVSDYAHLLTASGVGRGDRVMVQVEKSPQCLFLYFACLATGAIYLPLNTAYRDRELAYFVTNATPSLIVCDPARLDFFSGFTGTRLHTLDREGKGSLRRSLDDFTPPDSPFKTVAVAGDEVAAILYTSGTTGQPKGAMITHDNLIANALTLLDAWQWQAGDIMLHALPVFHIHGLFVALHLAVLNASPIIFLPAFEPEQVLRCLPLATVYMGVPTHYVRLLATGRLNRAVCRNMRLFTCGSAPLLPQTFTAFNQHTGHEIVERYGMTETGMNTSNPLTGERKPGTVGPLLPGVQGQILDDRGAPVKPGQTGELLIKGPNVFSGYWQMPDRTAREFTGDGYFRTGDLARMDEDGYVSIVGRNKDMIISGGLNIYPREIESEIDRLDGVVESAVIGLPHPDFGEGVCAIVVTAPDTILKEQQVIDHIKAQLANFKAPRWVYFVDTLPRNTMGKVQKNLLREKFTPGASGDTPPSL